jgi:hypothetical protein
MDKKLTALLIEKSLSDNRLDNKKILNIADGLNRKQLKAYIDGLKRWWQKNTVIVESAKKVSQQTQGEFRKLYTNKQVLFQENPDLIIGTRVIDNDTIYELNLKDTLNHIRQYIAQG